MGQNTRRISATRRASGTSNIIRKRQECGGRVVVVHLDCHKEKQWHSCWGQYHCGKKGARVTEFAARI